MSIKSWFNTKFDLSKTEDKLKLFIIASGLLIFLAIVTVGGIQLTMYPSFCKMCHEMNPEYVTWKASSHSQFKCTECHIEPGVVNLMKHKISAMTQLYQHVTGGVERPIKMPHEIKAEQCKLCHSSNRRFTVSGDIIIPHDRHEAKEVACVKCHFGVAHGKIVERGLTEEGKAEWDAWTEEVGVKEMSGKNPKPQMDYCVRCHSSRGVSIACETCHKTIRTPDSHKKDEWKTKHGITARVELSSCKKCHNIGFDTVNVNAKDAAAAFAKGNKFCSDCHSKKPKTHGSNWRDIHKNDVANKGLSNCLACHDLKPGGNPPAKQVNCTICHSESKFKKFE